MNKSTKIKESKTTQAHGIYGSVERIVTGQKKARLKTAPGSGTETMDSAYQYTEARTIYDRKGRAIQSYDQKGSIAGYSDHKLYDAQDRLIEHRNRQAANAS